MDDTYSLNYWNEKDSEAKEVNLHEFIDAYKLVYHLNLDTKKRHMDDLCNEILNNH